jgi:hypothetical protein
MLHMCIWNKYPQFRSRVFALDFYGSSSPCPLGNFSDSWEMRVALLCGCRRPVWCDWTDILRNRNRSIACTCVYGIHVKTNEFQGHPVPVH